MAQQTGAGSNGNGAVSTNPGDGSSDKNPYVELINARYRREFGNIKNYPMNPPRPTRDVATPHM